VILVDTSVWIDHLRATEPILVDALERDEVACHPLVIQELALGSIKDRDVLLSLLGQLTQAAALHHDELLTFVTAQRLWSKGLSSVDAHLLGSVLLSPATRLWTRDKSLKASAASLNVPTVDWH
jgi:predicted nucleic acid-binding protein